MSQPGVVRKKSLRIPAQPLQAPIPPSLLRSPHLNSPQSIFRRAMSPPRLPSVDDEWLQDTVPQHGAVKPPQQETKREHVSTELRSRRASQSSMTFSPSAVTPGGRPALPTRLGQRSEPNISRIRNLAEQDGYFVGF
ncbi:hypothetical protein C8R44DRAFT_884246 [Mycena epipterygia]|nr:hypothetical protein C8R44DRAFT_884246 [Mycena epipterygia]